MEASITGAGLILAVYALIIPVSHHIFEELNTELKDKETKFEKLKNNLTIESKTNEVKELNKLIKGVYLAVAKFRLKFWT